MPRTLARDGTVRPRQALRAALLAGDAGAGPSAPVEVDAEDVTVDEDKYVRNEHGVVTEVDGLQLHLSSRSETGYLGVRLSKSDDRFRAEHADTNLGTFDTAVEAAVA